MQSTTYNTCSLDIKFVSRMEVFQFCFLVLYLQVIGTLRATDKDEKPAKFTFQLVSGSSNFSIKDNGSKSLSALSIHLPFCTCLLL